VNRLRSALLSALVLVAGTVHAQADVAGTIADPAAALRTRFAALKEQLARNQFQRPLWMESSESSTNVAGKIYAVVDYPFATAAAALDRPAQWCDILILHLNTKYCRPSPDGKALDVKIGKKFDQPVEAAYRVDFDYRVVARTASFLQVALSANDGPLSTRDYRIVLEAAPADDGRTLIRLSYSYSFGTMGRLAMEFYLGTLGRDKVGFTVTGKESDGRPSYVKGMRGVVERNTMRYYLAIEAYLGAQAEPAQARVDKSLRDWFAATEGYARQLHEMERGEYLEMKRKEYTRQQVLVVTKS
jgi:hypothetical protein